LWENKSREVKWLVLDDTDICKGRELPLLDCWLFSPYEEGFDDFSYLLEVLGYCGPMGVYVVFGFNYISVS
jgi:hypothetical protein